MAVNRFAGMGWLLCGMIAAPACYLVNSYGAAEQARLNATKAAIVQAQKDIRGLETEFNTRANLAQLERWNGEVLSLAAATPQQYLASETALADLDRQDLGGAQIQTAALIVPAGAPAVQTAAVAVVPAAVPVQGAPQAAVPAKVAQQGAGQDKELRRLMTKADRRVAMIDKGVLSASTIDDLEKLAKREKLALR